MLWLYMAWMLRGDNGSEYAMPRHVGDYTSHFVELSNGFSHYVGGVHEANRIMADAMERLQSALK